MIFWWFMKIKVCFLSVLYVYYGLFMILCFYYVRIQDDGVVFFQGLVNNQIYYVVDWELWSILKYENNIVKFEFEIVILMLGQKVYEEKRKKLVVGELIIRYVLSVMDRICNNSIY